MSDETSERSLIEETPEGEPGASRTKIALRARLAVRTVSQPVTNGKLRFFCVRYADGRIVPPKTWCSLQTLTAPTVHPANPDPVIRAPEKKATPDDVELAHEGGSLACE